MCIPARPGAECGGDCSRMPGTVLALTSLRKTPMWIVRLALRRPYTFIVLALLIAVMGVLSIFSMPMDIFPRINIPVVTVIWGYGGLSPTEMQNRIVTITDRAFTTTLNRIQHIESLSPP